MPGKMVSRALEPGDQVAAHFVFYAAGVQSRFGELFAGAQFPQRLGKRVSCRHRWLLFRRYRTGVSRVDARRGPFRRSEDYAVFMM